MRLAAIVAAALVLSPAALAGLPNPGKLVAGRSLAGVRIGETQRGVTATLGRSHGVCTGCTTPTWYYNIAAFDQHGLGIEFTRGHVSAVYTIWQPNAWTGPKGLTLGAPQAQVDASAGTLIQITCPGYDAWVTDRKTVRTVYYILNGTLWGFGLMQANANPCR
ncbi:MAG TPA: hypothetical protein VF091_07980 [Gaiellaceae bacterium]